MTGTGGAGNEKVGDNVASFDFSKDDVAYNNNFISLPLHIYHT